VEDQNGLKKPDVAAIAVKGLLGAIPYVGPLVGEVVSTLIPNQRIKRLEKYVQILNEKLSNLQLSKEELERRLTRQESIDLLEDSFWQAARALSEERKGQIASLMKNSLSSDQLDHIRYKQLLSILGDLNDAELLMLKAYSIREPLERDKFYKQHESVFRTPDIVVVVVSPWLEPPELTILASFAARLKRMGLIEDTYVTPLGCLLLAAIDQAEEFWPKT